MRRNESVQWRYVFTAWLLGIGLPVLVAMPVAAEPELGYRLTEISTPTPAPGFSLQDMDEVSHTLEDYRGKVVMINFWATWCPPCRREMPSMQRLYQMLRDEGFVVLAVNQFESPDHVFAFTGQFDEDISFPILFDTESKLAEAYKVRGLPSTYLVDRQGQLRYRAIGGREFDHPEVIKLIRSMLQ